MATGVLVIGINAGTRALQFVAAATKRYDATLRLGQRTNTDDAEGELLSTADASAITDDAISAALAAQVGNIMQTPPAYSAIKVKGVRAYASARAGEAVELAPRPVEILEIKLLAIRRSGEVVDVDFSIHCGKGTYVRAVARDVGLALGVGGHLTALRRTENAGFTSAEAVALPQVRQGFISLAAALPRFMQTIEVTAEEALAVAHGKPLHWRWPDAFDPVAVIAAVGGTVLAIGRCNPDAGQLEYHAVFSSGMAG